MAKAFIKDLQKAVRNISSVSFYRLASFFGGYTPKEIKTMNLDRSKVFTVDESAKQLGFNSPEEMYPEYPLPEPPKLWLIKQRRKLTGRPWWEKDVMRYLGLYREGDISIQMNTERVNDKLWIVKHLVGITPILFPNGLPTEEDIGHTHLKHTGEFVIKTKVEHNKSEDDLIPKAPLEDHKVVDGYRMCNNCRHKRCLQWNMCQKIWMQGRKNNIESIGPRMFNYVDNPAKENQETNK